jgi:hypothetical protein
MIDNSNKVAVVFGVRNDSSIAYDVAVKLHRSGCKVALSYMSDTKNDVLYLMENLGMDTQYAMEVDVRDEAQISTFLQIIFCMALLTVARKLSITARRLPTKRLHPIWISRSRILWNRLISALIPL